MRPRFMLVALPALLLLAVSAVAQEKLVLLPERPTVGEPFQVLLQPAPVAAPAADQYAWEVKVLDEENKDITPTAAPKTLPKLPALMMPAAQAHARYLFKLKIKSPAKEL